MNRSLFTHALPTISALLISSCVRATPAPTAAAALPTVFSAPTLIVVSRALIAPTTMPVPTVAILPAALADDSMAQGGKNSSSGKPASDAEYAVEAEAQMVMGNRIMINRIKMAEAGWVVIHADDNGAAGEVLGGALVKAGETTMLQIRLTKAAQPSMIAMLYLDKGKKGKLELNGPDTPVLIDGKTITVVFDAMIH